MCGLEALLGLQRPPNCPIDRCLRPQRVVVQILERGVQTVGPTMGLLPKFVRICQAPEARSVGFDAVPAFRPCHILDSVEPRTSLWDLFMLVPVPLGVGNLIP